MPTDAPRKIGLVLAKGWGYCRDIARGIATYALPPRRWKLHLAEPIHSSIVQLLDWKPDGVIALIHSRELADGLARLNCPLVNISNRFPREGVPRVGVDDLAVGAKAAQHLLRLGFTRFGFLSFSTDNYAIQRRAGYAAELHAAGYDCLSYDTASQQGEIADLSQTKSWVLREETIRQWLLSLQTPIAIFCSNDYEARQVADVCFNAHLRVPADIALLGVDDDEFECQLSYPPLSSIGLPGESIGLEAATLLDNLMNGKQPPSAPVLFPPTTVISRRSTPPPA